MYAVTEIFDRPYLYGIALNWALIPATNYLVYLFWVFRVGGRGPAAAQPHGAARPAIEQTSFSGPERS
jgi:hypothetical protein